jgi:alcohol dehydrogenase (cytochrome c)
MGTLDAHLVAIDARTGSLLWNSTVADAADPACQVPNGWTYCYNITLAPLVVRDKVLVGVGGGDGDSPGYGIRGFIAAFDAATGKEIWRFHTIPAPGEAGSETWSGDSWKTGGAGVWLTGSYDADLNLTYWGTGNPMPASNGATRLGDNLYSDSVVALDADTGALRWHYQFMPHDEIDWDAAQIPVLVDLEWQGRLRKAMLWANRNGVMYVLDRATGQFLAGRPFVPVNWLEGFDQSGRPRFIPGKLKADDRSPAGTNWHSPSYSPRTGLFYVSAHERHPTGPGTRSGAVRAFDPITGDLKWEFKRIDGWFFSVLTTASDLVFSGVWGDPLPVSAGRREDGYFYALDARTGQLLWRTSLAGSVFGGGPITYVAGDRQYIAVTAGNVLFAFALRQ